MRPSSPAAGTRASLLVLLLDDGRPGHFRQVSALASFLPARQQVVPVRLRLPWRALAPRRLPMGAWAHRELLRQLPAARPAAAISCGRRSALVLRWLQDHYGEALRTVQILDAGVNPAAFSWVIAPLHDRLEGRNVIHTAGSLNPVDEAWLEWGTRFAPPAPPPPRLSLLLGGPSRHFDFDQRWLAAELAGMLPVLRAAGASLRSVTSPRTPAWVVPLLRASMTGLSHRLCAWSDTMAHQSQCDYVAALAQATHIAVTADSINLLSEACASGRTVLVIGAERARGRVARFVQWLQQQGYALDIRELEPALESRATTRVLRETPAVAQTLLRSGLLG